MLAVQRFAQDYMKADSMFRVAFAQCLYNELIVASTRNELVLVNRTVAQYRLSLQDTVSCVGIRVSKQHAKAAISLWNLHKYANKYNKARVRECVRRLFLIVPSRWTRFFVYTVLNKIGMSVKDAVNEQKTC